MNETKAFMIIIIIITLCITGYSTTELVIKSRTHSEASAGAIDSALRITCQSSFSEATIRDSLTIIENEPRCAELLK